MPGHDPEMTAMERGQAHINVVRARGLNAIEALERLAQGQETDLDREILLDIDQFPARFSALERFLPAGSKDLERLLRAKEILQRLRPAPAQQDRGDGLL